METTKLSSKGQVVLPKSIRQAHQWQAGLLFTIQETKQGILLRPLKPFKPTSWEKALGCANYSGPRKELEDMEKAIAKGVKDRHDRSRY